MNEYLIACPCGHHCSLIDLGHLAKIGGVRKCEFCGKYNQPQELAWLMDQAETLIAQMQDELGLSPAEAQVVFGTWANTYSFARVLLRSDHA